eukprot:3086202-Amphidinium_carterae.2
MYIVSVQGDGLTYWKKKVPLEKCLSGAIDGRSLAGLRAAWKRLVMREGFEYKLSVLKKYCNNAENAMKMAPELVASLTDEELNDTIDMLQEHEVVWPEKNKLALTQRKLGILKKEKKWSELLAVLSPFCTSSWNPSQPTVSALADTTEKKIALFHKNIFVDSLAPMLGNGEDAAPQSLQFLDTILTFLLKVDVVDLEDSVLAIALDESLCITRACLAILRPSWETARMQASMQVRGDKLQHHGGHKKEMVKPSQGMLRLYDDLLAQYPVKQVRGCKFVCFCDSDAFKQGLVQAVSFNSHPVWFPTYNMSIESLPPKSCAREHCHNCTLILNECCSKGCFFGNFV